MSWTPPWESPQGATNTDLIKLEPGRNPSAAPAIGADEWPPVIPLTHAGRLPTFPVNTFPDWLANFVIAEAEATQTPPDLAGMLALAVLATATQKKAIVRVRPGWVEPLNLWPLVILPPGSRKSGVFRDMTRPIDDFERLQRERLEPDIRDAQTRRKILEQSLNHAEGKAAKAQNWEQRQKLTADALDVAQELQELEIPTPPQLVADDATPESVGNLLAAQGGKLSVLSSEGDVFAIIAGRYSPNGPNLGTFLKSHAGDAVRVNRIGRPPEFIAHPALTMGLTIQPEVLTGLMDQAAFRGRGFLARFLYALPENLVGNRRVDPPPVPKTVKAKYTKGVKYLLALPSGTDDEGNPAAHALRLSDTAHANFTDFMKWLEPKLMPGDKLAPIVDWASKLAGAVARISGLLHLARTIEHPEPWREPIHSTTVDTAIHLGRSYLIPHARAAFAAMGADPKIEAAKAIVDWVERRGADTFTKRELFNAVRGQTRFKKAQDLDEPLNALVDHAYIREVPVETTGPGRKPSPVFEVNPHTQYTQNTHNATPTGNSADYADYADTMRTHKQGSG